jgi:hypothetical protein
MGAAVEILREEDRRPRECGAATGGWERKNRELELDFIPHYICGGWRFTSWYRVTPFFVPVAGVAAHAQPEAPGRAGSDRAKNTCFRSGSRLFDIYLKCIYFTSPGACFLD